MCCSPSPWTDSRRGFRAISAEWDKTNLARRIDGIQLAPIEQGEIGPDLFRHACLMGLEGLVSKHRESS
jgi:ATP-dependent DNA ligase